MPSPDFIRATRRHLCGPCHLCAAPTHGVVPGLAEGRSPEPVPGMTSCGSRNVRSSMARAVIY